MNQRKRNVLLVDDNSVDILVHRRALVRSGRFDTVESVNSSKEALILFENHVTSQSEKPDLFPMLLMLLDINMPVINGFEFLDRFAQLDIADDPRFIVMLTSSSAETDKQRALSNARVIDYLVKPFNTADAHAIADKLDNWQNVA